MYEKNKRKDFMWLEYTILGIVQGIAEWLPVSSEGLVSLIKIHFFPSDNMFNIIKLALFLHLGTFFSALVYLRKDVARLFKTLFHYKKSSVENKKTLMFLITSTIVSVILALGIVLIVSKIAASMGHPGKIIAGGIGILLILTGILQLTIKKTGIREIKDLTKKDAILLGLMQGFAALPGLSRSGSTIAMLLLRQFDKKTALKLSFLMSLPIVLIGNIFLAFKYFDPNLESLLGFLFSFVFGLLTIHSLFKIAEKINFGYFVLLFGILTIFSLFI